MASEKYNATFGFFLCLLGIPCLLFGFGWLFWNIHFWMISQPVSATVVESQQQQCHGTKTYNRYPLHFSNSRSNSYSTIYPCWKPIVSYTFQGKSYRSPLNEVSYDGFHKIGSIKNVRVSSRRPDSPRGADFKFVGAFLLLLSLGSLAAGFGLRYISIYWRMRKARQFLLKNGVPVEAKVIEVGIDKMVSSKNRNPYFVLAQFKKPNSQYGLISTRSTLWEDPRQRQISKENTVTVLYDPQNPDNCMIRFK